MSLWFERGCWNSSQLLGLSGNRGPSEVRRKEKNGVWSPRRQKRSLFETPSPRSAARAARDSERRDASQSGKAARVSPHSFIASTCRIGLGNDIHPLAPGRALILGGVRIPFEKGPVGHSDGDALAHAICDALLGALALGDLGQHFPDHSPEWHKASSLVFVRRVREHIEDAGYQIVNIDSTVGLERPKLGPHIAAMRRKLAQALRVAPEQVSIKAKSGEGLDAVGRGRAVRADAVALIVRHRGS